MVAKYLLAVLAIVFLAAALLSLLRHGFPVRPAGRACFLPAGHLPPPRRSFGFIRFALGATRRRSVLPSDDFRLLRPFTPREY
jgi:hypothetical protein